MAESYLLSASTLAGSVAENAANRKELKCQSLATTHTFIPLAFETLGPINTKGVEYFNILGRASPPTPATSEKQFFCFSVYH